MLPEEPGLEMFKMKKQNFTFELMLDNLKMEKGLSPGYYSKNAGCNSDN